MNKFILIAVSSAAIANARAQDAASTPASSPDMNELREQVKALTETVKTLQHQVKDQQTTIDKLNQPNGTVTESPEPSPVAAASASPSPSAAAKAPGEISNGGGLGGFIENRRSIGGAEPGWDGKRRGSGKFPNSRNIGGKLGAGNNVNKRRGPV